MGLGSAMPSRVSISLSVVVNSGFADPVHQPYWKVKAQVKAEKKESARRLTLTSTSQPTSPVQSLRISD